jgi:hypothetical protein
VTALARAAGQRIRAYWLNARKRSVFYIVAVVVLLGGGNLLWTGNRVDAATGTVRAAERAAIAQAVARSNHQWCAALDLLTAHPAPKPADPAADPARLEAYQWYEVFMRLSNRFRC